MSLINQMLQDLDKRRASGSERGELPNQVRALPPVRKADVRWLLLLVVVGGLFVSALLAWTLKNQRVQAPAAVPEVAVVPPVQESQAITAASRLTLELERLPVKVDQTVTTAAERNEPKTRPTQRSAAAPAPLAAASVIASAVNSPPPAKSAEPAKAPEPTHEPPRAAGSTTLPSPSPPPPLPKGEGRFMLPADAGRLVGRVGDEGRDATLMGTIRGAGAVASLPAKAPPLLPAQVETPPVPAKPVAAAVPAAAPAPAVKPEPAIVNAQIDKRSQPLTPQQLAENEYRVAANFLNDGRLSEAQDGFRRALQHFPGHSGARQGLFGLLLDAKRNADAERVLQEGLRLNPNQPGFAMAVARLQLDREDMAGALETLQKTAPVALGSPEYVAFMAALFQRTSRHAEAVDYYRTALRLAPGSGVWWMGLGISLQALNRNGEAQDAFRRAKAANTLNPELLAFVDQRLKQLQ